MSPKSEFRRAYREARITLREAGYVQENGKSSIEAAPRNREPNPLNTMIDHFDRVTGNDYHKMIELISTEGIKPDITCNAMKVVCVRRADHFNFRHSSKEALAFSLALHKRLKSMD